MSPAARELVEWMRRLGWSQSEMARQLLVTPSHINQIVRGKAEPSAAMLQLLRLTVGRRETPAAAGPPAAADELETFWRELRRQRLDALPPKEKRKFVNTWAVLLGLAWPPRKPRDR